MTIPDVTPSFFSVVWLYLNFVLRNMNVTEGKTSYCLMIKQETMDYRTPFGERLNERVTSTEKSLRMLEPIENLVSLSRMFKDIKQLFVTVKELEDKIYTTKRVMNFDEVCRYVGMSDSALYKMTAAGTIPCHKPRGKMLYFDKYEIDEWLLQNPTPVTLPEIPEAETAVSTEPTNTSKRHGRRKKNAE